MSIFKDPKYKTQLTNGLKAQAVADALGDPFEFQRHPRYQDLADLITSDSPLRITDDTQMTLFGIEGVIRGGGLRNLSKAYQRWYITQQRQAPQGTGLGLLSEPVMYSVRAPGNTCLSALSSLTYDKPVVNDSKGCGTVMRMLPFMFDADPEDAVRYANITHQHYEIEATTRYHWLYAQQLIKGYIPGEHRGINFGQIEGDGGWTAMDCLNIGIWAFENCQGDYFKMLKLSILHGGDSDSTAAVAGALYGIYYGFKEDRLFDRLVEAKVITDLVAAL